MATVDFDVFDADNHYYEATDAFTRHLDPRFAKRAMQWAEVDGKRRLVVAGRINRFIPNPTFDPIARPGCLDDYFRGRSPADDIRGAFGQLEPIRPEYRDRAARLAVLDRQGLAGCFLFPTLGVGMEEALLHDPDAAHAAFHAFNEWLDEDWGCNHRERLFAAPYITLLDPDQAADEVRWAIGRGARVLVMRAGPVMAPTGGRSPADPVYDPLWKAIAEAGITVAYHSGEAGYGRYVADWGESAEFEAFRRTPLYSLLTSDRAIADTMGALICHGLFARFPRLRVATIESGSEWVPTLLKKLAKTYSMTPAGFAEDPVATFRRHIWVAPYYEDDIRGLADAIGADHVLFGSDWPHAEGLSEPINFVDDLAGFSAHEVRLVMRDNAVGLSQPLPS
ncbi:MAG: amidohydrolase [Acidimicrobiales bacterium]|nr:amidohydrolase [Acidimicrobiales bacterium]